MIGGGDVPLLIELVGAPSAGKTTLAQCLQSELERDGKSVWRTSQPTDGQYGRSRRSRSLLDAIMALLRLAARPQGRLALVARGIIISFKDASRTIPTWRQTLALLRQFAPRPVKADVAILDEGPFTSLITLFAHPGSPPDLDLVQEWLSRLPHPDVILLLQPDPLDLERRMEDRRDLPLPRQDRHANVAYALACDRMLRSLDWRGLPVLHLSDATEARALTKILKMVNDDSE